MKNSNVELVKAFFAALDSGDGAQFLSADFKWDGVWSEPLDKKAFLGLASLFQTAFPDLHRVIRAIQAEGDVVKARIQAVGTHTGPLDLSVAGLPLIPATSKAVTFPESQFEVTIVDDKITLVRDVTPPSPDAGIPGLLKALGVALPTE